jgi:hypothetical protein
MIDAAIGQIAAELNQFLKRTFDRSEDLVVVSNLLEQDGSVAPHVDNKVVVFLTNIEKETVQASIHSTPALNGPRTLVASEPLHLNLYLMFAGCFSGSNYPEALKFIATTIRFFQANPVFDHHNTPELDRRIDRLALDVENLDIQQLSNLWGILSTRYIPSIMYKMRMVTIDADAVRSEVYTVNEPRPSLGG